MSSLSLNTALIYLDDVLVAGQNFEEHITNLRVVLQRFLIEVVSKEVLPSPEAGEVPEVPGSCGE